MNEIQRSDVRPATPPDPMPTRTDTLRPAPELDTQPTTSFPMADEVTEPKTTKDKVTNIAAAIAAIGGVLLSFGIAVPDFITNPAILAMIGSAVATAIGVIGFFTGRPTKAPAA